MTAFPNKSSTLKREMVLWRYCDSGGICADVPWRRRRGVSEKSIGARLSFLYKVQIALPPLMELSKIHGREWCPGSCSLRCYLGRIHQGLRLAWILRFWMAENSPDAEGDLRGKEPTTRPIRGPGSLRLFERSALRPRFLSESQRPAMLWVRQTNEGGKNRIGCTTTTAAAPSEIKVGHRGGFPGIGHPFERSVPTKASREMNTSKSFIAVALQLAACAGLLSKDAKASPINIGASDDTRIGERIAKVRQMLSQTAQEQMAASKDVNGVRINWANWHKGGWRNGWRNGSRGNWGNGGWGNGAGFRIPSGWANIGWPNGGVLVAPGWHKYWFNH